MSTQTAKNIIKKRKGNALLIAILLSSLLILITVGLSRLVSSESRQIASLIRNGTAEYLAEGGNELGQLLFYNIESNQEELFDDEYEVQLTNDLEITSKINFTLQGTTNHIPIVPDDVFKQANENPTSKNLLFSRLLPAESVEIFLTSDTNQFEIEYYIESINTEALGQFNQADLDVLLFKLSGVPTRNNDDPDQQFNVNFVTEYFPAGGNTRSPNDNIGKSAQSPARIGTSQKAMSEGFSNGTFFEYSDGEESDQPIISNVANGTITFTETQNTQKLFSEFLNEHSQNVVTLTNAVNLAQINQINANTIDFSAFEKLREALGSIYYRVCSPTCDPPAKYPKTKSLVSPNATISSTGVFGTTTKNILSEISRPSAFSAFNFAIFQFGQD